MDPRCAISVEDEFLDENGNGEGLITIAEEELSSSAATARTVAVRNAIDLTTEQAHWLYFALGRILIGRGHRDPNSIHGITDEQAHAFEERARKAFRDAHHPAPAEQTPEGKP
jgi:hypothetical protein